MSDTGSVEVTRPRWLYAGLVASLALNLLFIGGLGAAAWHKRQWRGGHGPESTLSSFVRDLPAERQKLIGDDVDAGRQVVRPLRKAVRDAWFEANTVLGSEPFDRDKYRAALDKVVEAESRFKMAVTTTLIDTASKMTAEERRTFQSWRERRHRHKYGRGSHHDDKGDKD